MTIRGTASQRHDSDRRGGGSYAISSDIRAILRGSQRWRYPRARPSLRTTGYRRLVSAHPLVVVTGPPGAGKTTVSRLTAMRLEPAACVIESDWWWTTIVKAHIPPWLPEADWQNRTVVRSYAAAASAMASGGFSTVLDGIVGPWILDVVQASVNAQGLQMHYVVLRPTLDVCLERALSREGEERVPGHPALTDPEPIRQLWHQFSELGEFERHVLDNSSWDAAQTAERVCSLIDSGAALVADPGLG